MPDDRNGHDSDGTTIKHHQLDRAVILLQSIVHGMLGSGVIGFTAIIGALNIVLLRMAQNYMTRAFNRDGRIGYEGAKKMVMSLVGMTQSDLDEYCTQFEQHVTDLEIGSTQGMTRQ